MKPKTANGRLMMGILTAEVASLVGAVLASIVAYMWSLPLRVPPQYLKMGIFFPSVGVGWIIAWILYGFPSALINVGVAFGCIVLLFVVGTRTRVGMRTAEGAILTFSVAPWFLWWGIVPISSVLLVGVIATLRVAKVGGADYLSMVTQETMAAVGGVPGVLIPKPDVSRLPFLTDPSASSAQDSPAPESSPLPQNTTPIIPTRASDVPATEDDPQPPTSQATHTPTTHPNAVSPEPTPTPATDGDEISKIRAVSKVKINVLQWLAAGYSINAAILLIWGIATFSVV